MWPGQQPPGGAQNPHDQNPYQQPGYHQPNPYQQPGYQQPNSYQQPQPAAPGHQPPPQPPQPWDTGAVPPGPPRPPQDDGRKRATVIAITAAVAVVVAAVVTGVVVVGRDDDKKKDDTAHDGTPTASASPTPSPQPTDASGGASGGGDDARGSEDDTVKPVIPGWKPVVNPKRHNVFDVPPEWTVKSQGWSVGFADEKDKSGLKMLAVMTSPAFYKEDYCKTDPKSSSGSSLAGTGTKGAQGARSEGEAARNEALNWVVAAFDQQRTGRYATSKDAAPFTSEHGIKGSTAWATVTGVKKTDKCTTDGKAFTVTYTDVNGDFATWVLYAAKGVPDEVPDATIKKIMSSLRHLESAGSAS
ncbi:hypothetical protein RKE29_22715 [Streptomyces sp. B1866]|uniref:hypothetical protein n=1 Tax=Streptomyces sp. B1866 TaxID=3075431 RepID=UPI00288F358A|nr:hypothetical protein [Streptomyces sp. B1866]MDT3399424.1 hypothetical protein [Streptomyces sp. B1866]